MFVTFEGPEGAGKSTAVQSVAEALRADGLAVCTTREPGDGPLGREIRELLLHRDALDPRCELFLFLADRAQHVSSVIRPALATGAIVLSDRFGDSTTVYQGVARGLGVGLLRQLNDLATCSLRPDVTFLLDLDPEVGLSRLTGRDRLDAEPIDFHRAVREGFLAEVAADPDRWVVIDASQPADDVAKAVVDEIRSRLARDRRTPLND